MRAGLMTLLVAIAVGGLPAASAQDTSLDIYSAIIDQYRNDPERAIEQATALSPATSTAPPGRGIADAPGSVSEHLQAAMLMHLEAALILAKRKDGRAGAHIRAGQELGQTLGRTPDHAWFVHRWHLIVTTLFTGSAHTNSIRRNALPWNQAIASFERGLGWEPRR
jgi:hypothetical protein